MSKYIEYDCPHVERFPCCNLCQYKTGCNANVKHHIFNLEFGEAIYYKYLEDKLLPCAYCGSSMKLLMIKHGDGGTWGYKVECKHDKNCLLRYTDIKIPFMTSKKDVIKMCNQRYIKKRPKENK